MMNTREKILDKALEMFNERGIEYVGLRELAGVLHMRVSNITYYFPTKDDLVFALSQELSKANTGLITEREALTMTAFLDTLQQVFWNQFKFRCLLRSVVHLLTQNKHLAETYKKTQAGRSAAIGANLQVLVNGGYLSFSDEQEMELLVSGISLISRFWVSEAAISFRKWSTAEHIRHYLTLITTLLAPYATEKGKREIGSFLAGL